MFSYCAFLLRLAYGLCIAFVWRELESWCLFLEEGTIVCLGREGKKKKGKKHNYAVDMLNEF